MRSLSRTHIRRVRRGGRPGRSLAASVSLVFPLELKLELVLAAGPFVLDVELRVGGDAQALAADLNRERAFRLDRVGETAQFRDELRAWVGLLEIAAALLHPFLTVT